MENRPNTSNIVIICTNELDSLPDDAPIIAFAVDVSPSFFGVFLWSFVLACCLVLGGMGFVQLVRGVSASFRKCKKSKRNLIGQNKRMDRKKWIALSFALLLCVSSIVIFCSSPCHDHHSPQVPTAIRRDVRPIQTKEVATPAVSRASQSRTAVVPEDVSAAVAVVCGHEATTADRYEARNAALRSLARCRDLNADDVQALMAYLRTTGGALHVEREAALKNDVLNLLRNQATLPDGLVDLLMEMFACNEQPSEVRDYALQHLGALQKDDLEASQRQDVRDLFVAAAKDIREPFAGTALYSLAAIGQMSKAQEAELRRLTVAACGAAANPLARMSALQLAGGRGYGEVLPIVRKQLDGARRDAVTDMVAVGTLGLLGDRDDFSRLERLKRCGGQRLRPAVETAIRRIEGRLKQEVK